MAFLAAHVPLRLRLKNLYSKHRLQAEERSLQAVFWIFCQTGPFQPASFAVSAFRSVLTPNTK